jgi:hypothetical protein
MFRWISRAGVLMTGVAVWSACIPAPVLRPRDAEADRATAADASTDSGVHNLDAPEVSSPFDATEGAVVDLGVDIALAETGRDAGASDLGEDVAHTDAPAIDAGTCEAGRVLRAGSCVEIGPARPTWPMSTQTVTQRRPRLRWAFGPEADGARVEVCRDRGCATRVVSYTATGTEGAPPDDLPPGPLFWRVWARAGSAEALRPSAVWQAYVPWRSGSVHTAQRDTFDVNGDGYADLVVGVPDRRELRLYLGSATGPRSAVVLTDPFIDPASMQLGRAGDVNGDGRSDLLVRVSSSRWRVLYATEGGFDVNARTDINLTPVDASATLDSVDGVGDFNGDGFTDLAVTSTASMVLTTRVGLHPGSGAGASSFASETREMLAATSLRPMGDLNADGYEDLVTVAGEFGPMPSAGVRVYLGHSTRLAWTSFGPTVDPRVFIIRAAGRSDFNGDGFPDALTAGFFATDRVPLLLGSSVGLETSPLFVGPGDGSRTSAVCDADINGDGLADFVIEARNAQTVKVFLSGPSGPAPTATANIPVSSFQRGNRVVCAGDVDGDGFSDALIVQSTETGDALRLLRGDRSGSNVRIDAAFATTGVVTTFGL